VPKIVTADLTSRMLSDFCLKKLSTVLAPREVERFRDYILRLLDQRQRPAHKGRGLNWGAIATDCGVEEERLRFASSTIRIGFDALDRALRALQPKSAPRTSRKPPTGTDSQNAVPDVSDKQGDELPSVSPRGRPRKLHMTQPVSSTGRRRGVKPRAIVEFPEPLFDQWDDPGEFHEALDLQMRRFGDSYWQLHRAVVAPDERMDRKTISTWRQGLKCPRSVESLAVLARIERRYRLPEGYFKAKLPHPGLSATGHRIVGIGPAERRRLAWHLPDDFDRRPAAEREKILEWVRTVIVSGATDYRRFQAAAMKHRYAIRFPELDRLVTHHRTPPAWTDDRPDEDEDETPLEHDLDSPRGTVEAPRILAEEMATLIRFKTSNLVAFGYHRSGVWGEETAAQKVEHLGLLFGALAASSTGPVRGAGVPPYALTFGLLVFPAVWDWYLQWRERRRGFYTAWEVDMLRVSIAFTRPETGWIRQSPQLAARLRPIAGLVTSADIEHACGDWASACDALHKHASNRAKEIERIARVHRDPFEPILPILEAPSPVAEYRKITDEILRLMPDERRYPKAKAEAVRSFLLLRLGLHLGLRQKNLRQLLVRPRGTCPTPERRLEDLKCGELRWSDRDSGWEVFIPAVAFKNAHSSYFGRKPFRLVLPNLIDLYQHIEDYIGRHRRVLLGDAVDPGTFFVKTVKANSQDAAYNQTTFYEAWRLVIQRYGVYNPYTCRGAIKGLLPHGPHNVRDVLATHILKQTGSYEQASYAIQDTPEMVAQHYGRFLPQDKAALAARILNQVWEAA
jgi:hypothetical protein